MPENISKDLLVIAKACRLANEFDSVPSLEDYEESSSYDPQDELAKLAIEKYHWYSYSDMPGILLHYIETNIHE